METKTLASKQGLDTEQTLISEQDTDIKKALISEQDAPAKKTLTAKQHLEAPQALAPQESFEANHALALEQNLDADIDALLRGRHANPFHILGPHTDHHGTWVRVFLPTATTVTVVLTANGKQIPLTPIRQGFFIGIVPTLQEGQPDAYRLHITQHDAPQDQETEDPYAFGLLLGELDLYLISAGRHELLADCLGAHVMCVNGIEGVRFAIWAPHARHVSVVGDFNNWDGRTHTMRQRTPAGIWELFIPRLPSGSRYQYEIVGAGDALLPLKADPLARETECPPAVASIVPSRDEFVWTDAIWMAERGARHTLDAPISIYEVHVGSWLAATYNNPTCIWDQLTERLLPYVCHMGFTHLELMPIMEHPFGGSWGYQPLSLFAPSARYGPPAAFARFVDACHARRIGLILDWVPAHFPGDVHGLAQFDGTALYEYSDPREGFHPDWHTLIYNLGRPEVRNFMLASALEWLRRYHIDGLRVDAVASMLYRNYSRAPGEWIPNQHGGYENLEAIAFLREMNEAITRLCPGTMTIAEESSAWPRVTAPLDQDGLGFTYKWNLGWMHDTLRYLRHDPEHRHHPHHDMTFGMAYAYTEHFILSLSHDEVVHGKKSLLHKMPGDSWQRFATLRAYFGYMWAHPGRKLLFMGGEIAQEQEWNHDAALNWQALENPLHQGVLNVVRDLNHLYRELPALHRRDADPEGFTWIIQDDTHNNVFAFLRTDGHTPLLAISNFKPVSHYGYRVGVTHAGYWQERLNTNATEYGGSGVGNMGGCTTHPTPAHHQPYSLVLTLPPLATLFFQYKE